MSPWVIGVLAAAFVVLLRPPMAAPAARRGWRLAAPARRGRRAAAARRTAELEWLDALTAELEEEFASDDPAAKFAPHREGFREGIVGRLVDDDALDSDHDDVTAHDSGEDDDLTAEESALHYVDPENDPIPE